MGADEGRTSPLGTAYNNPHLPTSLHILGTQGALVGDDCSTAEPVGTVSLWRGNSAELVDVGPRENLYRVTVRAFRAAVHGQGDVIVSGEDGIRSLAVSLAVLESLRSGLRIAVAR